MTVTVGERIEILPVSLLNEHRSQVNQLKSLARSLKLEFGWHYLLDLTWMLVNLEEVRGKKIMDAGAGTGVLQWHLANSGAQVWSVDRASRAGLPLRFRKRFNVTGQREEDLLPETEARRLNRTARISRQARLKSTARDLLARLDWRRAPGSVIIYNQDLKTLEAFEDNFLDAIVAVSALEHNAPGDLVLVVDELMRVLKPGGILLATLGAARDEDWFHEPSHGWCYTEASLRRLFGLSPQASSNYDRYDELFTSLNNCAELRDNLASFYSRSGDNGMPWGKWDPQYQTVGILKVKPADK
jgi:SAM-dependent methyltransferase